MKLIKLEKPIDKLLHDKNLNISRQVGEIVTRPIPGEWVIFQFVKAHYIGFANPIALSPSYYVLEEISVEDVSSYVNLDELLVAKKIFLKLLDKAIFYRLEILPYGENSRLVYGSSDLLPGLIIDSYKSHILVQINTLGIDRLRDVLNEYLKSRFGGKEIVFVDDEKQRKREMLPIFPPKRLELEQLYIQEGKINLKIDNIHWQKNGYYYDHRDNRKKFYQKLTELKLNLNNGVDLFCYLGSWGITALSAGVKHVDFVDQANLESQLSVNLRLNDLDGKGDFHRSDVFEFLDHKIHSKFNYDVIISDPPSFAKSPDKKNQAIYGYKKLHKKVLEVAKRGSVVCFASCTHYVNQQEFESTIYEAASTTKKSLKLIDIGTQSLDHPFANFHDKSYYLKYLSFFVE